MSLSQQLWLLSTFCSLDGSTHVPRQFLFRCSSALFNLWQDGRTQELQEVQDICVGGRFPPSWAKVHLQLGSTSRALGVSIVQAFLAPPQTSTSPRSQAPRHHPQRFPLSSTGKASLKLHVSRADALSSRKGVCQQSQCH